jgi:hypothetical protein
METIGILSILVIFAAFFAVLSVWFSLGAWIVGPAVKHLGQKWEEGKQQAKKSASEEIQAAYLRGINQALEGKIKLGPVTPQPDEGNTAGPPGPPRRHTITGRELP